MSAAVQREALQQQDASNRLEALDLDSRILGSYIVEAPAGAGKTELLTQRYLRLLAVVDAPEEIIALTFTNKAATEMRNRILQSLKAAQNNAAIDAPHKQQTRKLALAALARDADLEWQLIAQPARLRILTIDALCGSLTQQMPLLSRFGGQPVLVDNAQLHYETAVQNTLAQLDDETDVDEPISKVLAFLNNQTETLSTLLCFMLAQRDQWLSIFGILKPLSTAQMALQTQAIMQFCVETALQKAAQVLTENLQTQLMPCVRYAASNLPDNHPIQALQDWNKSLQPTFNNLNNWLILNNFLLKKDGDFRKKFDVSDGFPPDKNIKPVHMQALQQVFAAINNTAALHDLRSLPVLTAADFSQNAALVAAFAQVLKLAAVNLRLVFQSANQVDFVAVTESAILALGNDMETTDLALKLDYQIAHILVDEFQDTNQTQKRLLELLTQGWQADDGRTLFCVGDPMQSIYRFRKADVGLFLEAHSSIAHLPLKPLKLSLNNRSHPEIIDWINHSFNQIFPKQDNPFEAAISYRTCTANLPENSRASVQVHPLVITADDESDAAKTHEAQLVVQLILAQQKQAPQSSIAVLVRSRSHLQALISLIRRNYAQTLPFQAVKIEPLRRRQTVLDALSLTRAMLHRADRVHWLNVLRAPWCGLKLEDLHTLCADKHHATIWQLMQDEARCAELTADGQLRLNHVKNVLGQAFAAQGRMPLRRWLETTWLQLGGGNALISAGDNRDIQAYLNAVENVADGYFIDFNQLDSAMQKLYAEPDLTGNSKLQFLTIHESKGLEFDCVILPALNTKPKNRDKPLMLWQEYPKLGLLTAPKQKTAKDAAPTIYDYLGNLENARELNETARLLYVAATRAKCNLHLLGTVKQNADGETKPTAKSLLAQLWPCVAAQFAATDVTTIKQENSAELKDFSSQLMRLPIEALAYTDTEIWHSETVKYAKSTLEAEENQVLNQDSVKNLSADCGVLVHLYMELFAKQGLHHWSSEKLNACQPAMQTWLVQHGYKAVEAKNGSQQVLQSLQTTLASDDAKWIFAARESAQNEYALTDQNGEQHVIDRTFMVENTRWIVDYKLGLEVTTSNANFVAQTHRAQLERYASLFSAEKLPIQTAVFFMAIGKLILLE